jgi:drug/metabolite transporter (DMT)-like permease
VNSDPQVTTTGGRVRLVLAFAAIYVVWGSTYLAIRYAVETIPPLLTAGVRHLVAGLVLYAWTRPAAVRVTAAEWRASFVVAVLFFLVGHGTLHWAEQIVPSGIAALLVATEPLWIALLVPSGGGPRLTPRTIAGLVVGLAGVALLVPYRGFDGGWPQLLGSAAILLGALSWAAGVRQAAVLPLPTDPFVRAATTLLMGAGLLLAASVATGEVARVNVGAISARSMISLAYLIVFGSLVAFSAYTWLLERCSATLVATHTYVNPVIAVLIGWWLGGEAVTPRTFGATALILSAIVLLTSASVRTAGGRYGNDARCTASFRGRARHVDGTLAIRGDV